MADGSTPYGGSVRGLLSAHRSTVVLNLVCGTLLGGSMAYAPVHASLVEIKGNCTLYGAVSCPADLCSWNSSANTCAFQAEASCIGLSSNSCAESEKCQWLSSSGVCVHRAGYGGVDLLLFYVSLLVGAVVGSATAQGWIGAYGIRRTLLLGGYVSIVGCAGVHASVNASFVILLLARIILGAGCGLVSCAAPLLVHTRTPCAFRRLAGVLFHVGSAFGGAVLGLVGLLVAPRDFSRDVAMFARMEVVAAFPLLVAVATTAVGHLSSDPTPPENDSQAQASVSIQTPSALSSGTPLLTNFLKPPPKHFFENFHFVGAAVALCFGYSLTGGEALKLFAPTITTTSADVSSLTGNFFLQGWCFAASLVSLLLVLRNTLRTLFVVGTALASVGCAVIATTVWSGVLEDDDSRRAAIGLGIALFFGGYEMGIAPAFYPLQQEVQHDNIRVTATSFSMALAYVLNIGVVVAFPIVAMEIFPTTTCDAVTGTNGVGGLSIAFTFFSACGAIAIAVCLKVLPS